MSQVAHDYTGDIGVVWGMGAIQGLGSLGLRGSGCRASRIRVDAGD